MITDDGRVQPPSQPSLVARFGLTPRVELFLELLLGRAQAFDVEDSDSENEALGGGAAASRPWQAR